MRDDARVPLTPRAVDLLAVLVARSGEVLDKNELIEQVWGGTVVEENNLARQISSLRKALGETPGNREYIGTVPGVGYRFVAPVVELPAPVVSPTIEERHLPSDAPGAIPPSTSSRSADFFWLGILTAMAALAVTVVLTFKWTSRSYGPAAPAVQRSLRQFTSGPGLQSHPTWSPDGSRLAFASDRLGNSDIWIQSALAEPVRITTSPARDWQPDWSPDGQWIVYRSEQDGGGLYVISADGGQPRRISSFGANPRWSPSGNLILFSNATMRTGARELFVISPSGGDPRQIAQEEIAPLTSSFWASAIDAAWFPDGRHVSVWGRPGDEHWAFVTVPVDGGTPVYSRLPESGLRDLDEQHIRLGQFVWARSGKFLYFQGESAQTRNIWRVAVDPATLAWEGNPERLTTDVGEEVDLALSPSGGRLAFSVRSHRTSVWGLDFDPRLGRLTGRAQALTPGSSGDVAVDTPRDGSRLVYRSVTAGRTEVGEVTTADRQERVLLVSNDWSTSTPTWSSDGRRIAYSRPTGSGSSLGAPNSLVAVLSTNPRQEQLLTIPSNSAFRPSDWSSDGATILGDCRSRPGEASGICVLPAPGSAPAVPGLRVLVHDPSKNLYGPRFSPDQRWISFVAVDVRGSTTSQIFIAPVSGGRWTPITDGQSFDDKVRWAPDGRMVYFVSDRDGYLNLRARTFDPVEGAPVGDPFGVTSFDTASRGLPSNPAQIEFSVADRRLFLPITETEGAIWVLGEVDK
jgi:Tol biopolymer transport system component/DNA-binding winged helix-turn-helix (wHTH) protein